MAIRSEPVPDVDEARPVGSQASSLRRAAVRGGTILVGSRLAVQVLTWLVTIEVSRLLQPLDYAVMTAGMMVVGFCDLLADAGIGRALIHREPLHHTTPTRHLPFPCSFPQRSTA
jgi:O-antigen/teichoic acid export membrane protein